VKTAYAVGVRASDEDRQRVITALQRHTEAGRLTLDEFSDRVGTVYAAKTLDDLRVAVVDLPVLAPAVPPVPAASPAVSNERQLLLTFMFAVIAVALIGTAYALFH
jgi:hypothetical protein